MDLHEGLIRALAALEGYSYPLKEEEFRSASIEIYRYRGMMRERIFIIDTWRSALPLRLFFEHCAAESVRRDIRNDPDPSPEYCLGKYRGVHQMTPLMVERAVRIFGSAETWTADIFFIIALKPGRGIAQGIQEWVTMTPMLRHVAG